MASPSVAERARSRKPIEGDDAVMMRAAELAVWARNNARLIIGAAVAALVVVGGILYYNIYKQQRAERASEAYLQVQGEANADTANAARKLEAFASRFPGTTEAAEARVDAAGVYMDRGNAAKAVEVLRPVADGGTPLALQGKMMLAAALAAQNKRADAEKIYTELGEKAPLLYQQQDALSQLAALREQAGDWKGAVAAYDQMLAKAEKGNAEYQALEMRRAEAQARAGGAPAPAAK